MALAPNLRRQEDIRRATKQRPMEIKPKGTPKRAHPFIVIPGFEAAMMFGMFPGMRMPPAIRRPRRTSRDCVRLMLGDTSAAARLALSKPSSNALGIKGRL